MNTPTQPHPSSRTQRGFTLVEVLVAITIMSVIAVMSWQGVDSIVRTRGIAQARLEQLLRTNTVLAQWEQDLNALQKAEIPEIPNRIRFNGASVTMTREAEGGMQVVVWSLRSGVLQRWAGPPVTSLQALQEQFTRSSRFIGNEAGQLRLLTGLQDWQLYYYINNTWANAQSDAISTGDGISGVRLVMNLAGQDGSGQITRDILSRP